MPIVPKPKYATPVGTQVLVELLTPKETLGTRLHLDGDMKVDTPQGYVLNVGPMVPKEFGVQKGDRVFISTPSAVFPPLTRNEDDRQQVCVEYMTIRGVLHE